MFDALWVLLLTMDWCDEGEEAVPIFLLSEREINRDDPEVVEEMLSILNSVDSDERTVSQDVLRPPIDYLRQGNDADRT